MNVLILQCCLVHWGGFLNFPIVFKSAGKNQKKKIKEKREFLRKTSFRPNRFFYIAVTQKLITLNFKKILTFFEPLKHKPPFSPTIENYFLG
ncbi:Uncharacterized protein FWK35_00032589, partial [Aphis craccivora]